MVKFERLNQHQPVYICKLFLFLKLFLISSFLLWFWKFEDFLFLLYKDKDINIKKINIYIYKSYLLLVY
jgi:hypothetical protein